MTSRHCGLKRIRLISILTLVFLVPASAFAQGVVATPSELRDAIRKSVGQKEKDREQVRSFFASPEVRGVLSKGGMDVELVQKAVASLDDESVARLAAQTYRVQKDFAAGALSNQELTYIVIALATAVIVIVLIKA